MIRPATAAFLSGSASGSASYEPLTSPIVTRHRESASRFRAQAASGSPAATRIDPSGSRRNPTAARADWPLMRPRVSMMATLPHVASCRPISASEAVMDGLESAAPLPGLALGLDGRRVDHLDLLHLADGSRAKGGRSR